MLRTDPSPVHPGCSLSQAHAPAQTQSASFETLQANLHLKSHPAALRHFQNLNFSERKGSTISGVGWGPQQKSVKPTSHTAALLYCYMRLLIPLAHGFPSLSRPCFVTHQLLAPKANASTPYPRTTWKASLLSSAVTDTLEKKKVRCISIVLPSNPSNLEEIRIEAWKKVWKLRGTLLCKEISSLRNTKLYFPQSSKNWKLYMKTFKNINGKITSS